MKVSLQTSLFLLPLFLLVACHGFDAAQIAKKAEAPVQWIESKATPEQSSEDVPFWGHKIGAEDTGELSYAERIENIIAKSFAAQPPLAISQDQKFKQQEANKLQSFASKFEAASRANNEENMKAILEEIGRLSYQDQQEIFRTSFPLSKPIKNITHATLLEMFAFGDPEKEINPFTINGQQPGDSEEILIELCKKSDLTSIREDRPMIPTIMISISHKVYAASRLFSDCGVDPNFSRNPLLIPNYFQQALHTFHPGLASDMMDGIIPADPYALDRFGNTPIALALEAMGTHKLGPNVISKPFQDTYRALLKKLVSIYKADNKSFFLKSQADHPAMTLKLQQALPKESLQKVVASDKASAKNLVTEDVLTQLKKEWTEPFINKQVERLVFSCSNRGFKDCTPEKVTIDSNIALSFQKTAEKQTWQPLAVLELTLTLQADEHLIDELYQAGDVQF
ncbi:MAG: hypothetical protein KDD61_02220 [Bdellovibrionales bacterium]|nr:hypothetical protein [Bdellovibrionales bacterium]